MQISQLITHGLPVVAIKEFSQLTSVEISGTVENFIQSAKENKSTVIFLNSTSVSELMIETLHSNGFYGYTADMTQNLLSAMTFLSAMDSHKLKLSQIATDEICELRRSNLKNIQAEIAEYQLATSIDGILVKSPTYRSAWTEYFQNHLSDIVAQENKERISRIAKHNSHLKINYVPVYA